MSQLGKQWDENNAQSKQKQPGMFLILFKLEKYNSIITGDHFSVLLVILIILFNNFKNYDLGTL